MHRQTPLILACLFLLTPAAHAEGSWTLGLGAGVSDGPYIDKRHDGDLRAMPFATYESEDFYVGLGTVGLHMLKKESGPLVLLGNMFLGSGGDGFKAKDSPRFQGMARRRDRFDAGLELVTLSGLGATSLSLRRDAFGPSKALSANLSHSLPLELGPFQFEPSLGLSWLDDNHVDYYYGVRPQEATATRRAYRGQNTLQTTLGYSLSLPLGKSSFVMQGAEYSRYGHGISDSPLVDRKDSSSVFVGLGFSF